MFALAVIVKIIVAQLLVAFLSGNCKTHAIVAAAFGTAGSL